MTPFKSKTSDLIRSIIHANKGKHYNAINELFHNLYVELDSENTGF